jgi:CubicO group peptidase (beta-lactamase class C family)
MILARRILGAGAACVVCAAVLLPIVTHAAPQARLGMPAAAAARLPDKDGIGAARRMSDAEIVTDIRFEMGRLAAESRFSGAVLFSKNGRPLFEHAYGFANHAFNAPNKVDTKFNMASVTKVFTAVAILQLAEQGKLALDETLAKALPDYPNQEVASKITILELLEHRSGLGDFFGKEYEDSNPSEYRALQDYLPLFANRPLLFEPGTKVAYSNAGFMVLGLVIEHLSGQSYDDYVQDHIFKQAGMTDTGFWSYQDDVPNLALGYTQLAPGELPGGTQHPATAPREVTLNLARGVSAGGSSSTVEDLMRFSEALRTQKLLKPESVELLLKGGYGMLAGSNNGVRYAGHGGGAPGTNTYFEIYPDQGYAVVVLANVDPPAAEAVAQRLRQEIVGAPLPKAIGLPAEALKQFEGKYAVAAHAEGGAEIGPATVATVPGSGPRLISGPGGAPTPGGGARIMLAGPDGQPIKERLIEVTADREGLWVTFGIGATYKFVPLSATEFFDRDSLNSARLVFTKDQNGRFTNLSVKGVGFIPSTTATRLP